MQCHSLKKLEMLCHRHPTTEKKCQKSLTGKPRIAKKVRKYFNFVNKSVLMITK